MSRSEKRSPWVVLAIPFPSDKATAKRAFSRRSRMLRRDPGFPWSQEDLSWAEAEITLSEEHPESTVDHYRVPADPGAFERPLPGELFVPDARPIARRTDLLSPSDLAELDAACEQQVLESARAWSAALQPDLEYDPYGQPAARPSGGEQS